MILKKTFLLLGKKKKKSKRERGKRTNEHAETVLAKGWTAQLVFGIGSLLNSSIQNITRHWGLLAGNTVMLLSYPFGHAVKLK